MSTTVANKGVFNTDYPPITHLSQWIDSQQGENTIGTINWRDYPYQPSVKFKIGYSEKEIILKFYVDESVTKAEYSVDNSPVYEDSCVELFLSPGDDGSYYNFEFNAIGTSLLGFGKEREGRVLADKEIVSSIRRLPSIGKNPFKERICKSGWSLTVAIPFTALFMHKIEKIDGITTKANLYKCGDKLSMPHFLSWNRINSDNPDFHRPEFFGEIVFR